MKLSWPKGRGWDLLRRALVDIDRNNLFGLASQLAYSFLFALPPFVICLVALAAFLPVQDLVQQLLQFLQPFLPGPSYDLLATEVLRLVTRRNGGLLTVGFAVALWSASSALTTLMTSLNFIHGVRETRPFWKTRGLALGLTIGGGLTALLAILILTVGGRFGHWVAAKLGYAVLYSKAWSLGRWPIATTLVWAGLVVLYRWCPNRKSTVGQVVWGALFGAAAWLLISLGFSFYLAHFTNFGATYGSLGTVVAILTWLYFNGAILVLGGQLNALLMPDPDPQMPITASRIN